MEIIMDFKVMAAVLLSLLVLGVGMRTYDIDVNDLSNFKNLSDKVGGFENIDFSGGGSAEGTKISADFVSGGNVSDMRFRGNMRTLRIEGDEVEVDAGFSTTDDNVLVKNLSGSIEIVGDNLSVSGRTRYVDVGDREMRSDTRKSIEIKTKPSKLYVENVSDLDFTFDEVEGSIDFGAYSLEMNGVPLELERYTGTLERDFGQSSFVFDGVVRKGSIGEGGSRTVIGD